MGGDEEVDRRSGHRGCNAPMGGRPADRARDLGVGNELTEREPPNGAPHGRLKVASVQAQGQIEPQQAPVEIGSHLPDRFAEQCVAC